MLPYYAAKLSGEDIWGHSFIDLQAHPFCVVE